MTEPTPGGAELLAEAKALGLDVFYTNLTGGKLVIQWKDKDGSTKSFCKRRPERRKSIVALEAEVAALQKEVLKQVAGSKVVFDREVVDRAKEAQS